MTRSSFIVESNLHLSTKQIGVTHWGHITSCRTDVMGVRVKRGTDESVNSGRTDGRTDG